MNVGYYVPGKNCGWCFSWISYSNTNNNNKFKREGIWVFFRKFRVVSVCFGLLQNSSVCFGCFDIGSQHRNKPKLFGFAFTKQTEKTRNRSCFGLFRFEPKIIFVCFEDTLITIHSSVVWSVAQLKVRWPGVRQARVQLLARYPRKVSPTEHSSNEENGDWTKYSLFPWSN